MCDRGARSTRTGRLRWTLLYAIPPLIVGTGVLVESLAFDPALETVLESGITVVGFGAVAWWVGANRAAIDRRDWCACASSAATVRVIGSPAAHPVTRPAPWPRILDDVPAASDVPHAALAETREHT